MTPPVVRMFYVDDSGAEDTGWAVYSWVECAASDWRAGLRDWLNLRKALHTEHMIPADYELHATKFVGGRGHPSLDPKWNQQKHLRSAVAEQALAAIADSQHVRVGTVYRQKTARVRGKKFASEAADLYAQMIRHLDQRLGAAGELGLIIVDGNGSDNSYNTAHRALKLDSRNVIEDALFQESHRSQWVQMADLVAYAAYQHLLRHPGKKFAWRWYERFLLGSDVNGGPIEL